jgi:hypothetical protein
VVLLRKSNPQNHNLQTAVEHGVSVNQPLQKHYRRIDMTDRYRIRGKVQAFGNIPTYLMDIEIHRTIEITANELNQICNGLEEGGSESGWSEPVAVLRSMLDDSIAPSDIQGFESSWQVLTISNKGLSALALTLGYQDENMSISSSGSIENKNMTINFSIGGRVYSRILRTSKEASVAAQEMDAFKQQCITAGWNMKSIEKIATAVDWLLRASGAYDLAEKAYQTLKEELEADKRRRKEEKEMRDHISREWKSGIDRSNEIEIRDVYDRTC